MADYFNTMMATSRRGRYREPNDIEKVSAILAALGSLTGGIGRGIGAIQSAGYRGSEEERAQGRYDVYMKQIRLQEDARRLYSDTLARAGGDIKDIDQFNKLLVETAQEGEYAPGSVALAGQHWIRRPDQQTIDVGGAIEDAVTSLAALEKTRAQLEQQVKSEGGNITDQQAKDAVDAKIQQTTITSAMRINSVLSSDAELKEAIAGGDMQKAAERYRSLLNEHGIIGQLRDTLLEGGVESIATSLVRSGVAGGDEDPENAALASSLPEGFWNDPQNLPALLFYDKEGKLNEKEFRERMTNRLPYELSKMVEHDNNLYIRALGELLDLDDVGPESPLYKRAGAVFPISERGHIMPQGAQYGSSLPRYTEAGLQMEPQLQIEGQWKTGPVKKAPTYFQRRPQTMYNRTLSSATSEESRVPAKKVRSEDLARMLLYLGYAESEGLPSKREDIVSFLDRVKNTKDENLTPQLRAFIENRPDLLNAYREIIPPQFKPTIGSSEGVWSAYKGNTLPLRMTYNKYTDDFQKTLQALQEIIAKRAQ
jgi:hypothetical protein